MTAPTGAAAEAVAAAVLAMPMARTLGLRFLRIGQGETELEIPYDERWSYRPGYYQATPLFAVADFAGVSAAGTLLDPGWTVATVDCTLKIVAPARAGCLRARGRVVKAGRTLTVAAAEVYIASEEGESLCATALVAARNVPPAA